MAFTPNEQQAAVLEFTKKNPGVSVNLIARAGTGKSTTLVWLAPQLEGTVLMLAFNKSAAVDLQDKLVAAGVMSYKASACTVHSCGIKTWKRYMGNQRVYTNEYKVWDLIDDLGDQYRPFKVFLGKWISFAKQSGIGFFGEMDDRDAWYQLVEHYSLDDELPGDNCDIAHLFKVAVELYDKSLDWCRQPMTVKGKRSMPTIDFDDMLLAPLFFKAKFQQFDNVLLDEAQDTNNVRRAIALASIANPGGRLIAVGDPAQAIYGFTGANHNSMDLIRDELDSTTLPLTMTYRCPKNIVAMAQQWVPDIQAHENAPDGVPLRILKLEKTEKDPFFWDEQFRPDDVILCRNTKPLVELAYMFLRRKIAVRIEGRDIGQGLVALLRKWKIKRLDAMIEKLLEYQEREVTKLQAKGAMAKADALTDKVDTLLCLIDSCQQEGKQSVEEVIIFIESLFGNTENGQQKCLTLSTVHKAKGREWPRVFALGRGSLMPSKWAKKDWEKQQERNLQYVLVTRVKSELIDVVLPPNMGKKKGAK